MIDFRYHLVSLVSVFMALAIGVVLGAGPLKESIGDTLTSQVQGLRDDKEALQQAVDNRDAALAHRDEAITALGGSVTAGTLAERSVAVLALPGAVAADVEAVSAQLGEAGATVASTVAVQPLWSEPDEESSRADLADALVQYLRPPPPPADLGTDAEMAALLSRAVLSTGGGERDADGQTVLDALVAAELVTVQEDEPRRADLAVLVTGAPADAAGAGDDEWAEAETASTLALALAADGASDGAVLTAPPSSVTQDGVVASLRGDADVAGAVSTVDVLDTPVGRVAVVLAVVEQSTGGVGHYGVGGDASGVLPPIPVGGPGSGTPPSTGTGSDG